MSYKKILIPLLLVALTFILTVALIACDKSDKDLVGITFNDVTVDYDGKEHKVEITGTLPEGVSARYQNNTATEPGEYEASVVLSGEGYKSLILTAKLTITAKEITGVTFSDLTVDFDGKEHKVEITGTLPEGVSVSYQNNTAAEVGVYNATAVLSGTGYKTLMLTAKLTISAKEITGVTFSDVIVDFDGKEHKVEITGTLPEGVSVIYKNNTAAEEGEYLAKATLSGKGYKTLELTAKLTIRPRPYVIVNNAQQLLEAVANGGFIKLNADIELKDGENITIEKDTYLNGMGHTVSAVGYSSNYRLLDIVGAECKNVTLEDINISADVWASYLIGINIQKTVDCELNMNGVSVKLVDYYAFNIMKNNVGLTVNAENVNFSAWGAINNHASGVTLNAKNSVFEGTNVHAGKGNGFSTIIVSGYIMYDKGAQFVSEELSANNLFTFTDCEIIAKIGLDANDVPFETTQKAIELRSPYNNSLTLTGCTVTRAKDTDKYVYSAYDSAYIPDENKDDPNYVVDTNKVLLDGVDVTGSAEYVEKYFDK